MADMDGDRIRRMRTWAGMSQEKFARTFGVSQATVWRWENGGRVPSAWHAAALEQFEKRLDQAERQNELDRFVAGIAGAAAAFGIGYFLGYLFDPNRKDRSTPEP